MTQGEFELIATQLRAAALTAARHLLSSAQDAEDTAGDTMLRLWAMHGRINSESHALKLASVAARNAALDLIRHRSIARGLFKDTDPALLSLPSESTPSADIEWQEEEQWLAQRMQQLPPRELLVLKMRQTEHRSNDEIARLMGISTTSVAVMLSNARRKLFNDIKARQRK